MGVKMSDYTDRAAAITNSGGTVTNSGRDYEQQRTYTSTADRAAAAPAPEGLDKEIDRALFKLDDEIGFQIVSDTRGPTAEGERQYQQIRDILRKFALRARPALSDETLRQVLEELVIDANRLCDRNQGGTYEDDCRRSIAKARAVLARQQEGK